jgi:D-alanyl-D-alanine carboxypeptidase
MTYEQYITDNIIKKLQLQQRELGFEIHANAYNAKGYQKQMSVSNLILGLFIDKTKYMGKREGKWKPFNSFYIR